MSKDKTQGKPPEGDAKEASPNPQPPQAPHRPALPSAPPNPRPQIQQRRPTMPAPRMAPRTRASPKGR